MTPKKKDGSSGSESSSSSSSSSSSTSSSSGSESSSSDTENSSTSNPKSGRASSDSDKKKAKKKSDNSVKTKNDSTEVEAAKVKEKPKRRASNSAQKVVQVYSSESDDANSKCKRKPPTKPKASATVTPIAKPAKPTPKPATKKQVLPMKQVSKPPPKEPNKPLQKPDTQKKLKTKSIFSPDNSSESDDNNATPPPPKLTAMKTAAAATSKTTKAKPKIKKEPGRNSSDKSRASSVTSNNSTASSNSSGSSSDSDSSGDSGRTNRTNVKAGSGAVKPGRSVGRPRKNPPPAPPPQTVSDSDANTTVTTRKQTRSASARRSKHLTGRTPSESETESESKTSSTTKSPVKKPGPKGPAAQRKPKARDSSESNQSLKEEERKCPLEQCDSLSHLSGKHPRHFTLEACPMYHNKTSQQCKDAHLDHVKREEERKKAQAALKTSHTNNPTADQKAYRELVRELRAAKGGEETSDSSCSEREPPLSHCASNYDLKLFQEAQALASETIEEDLKGLPAVRGTKCIEMGRFEMEVWYQSPYPDDYARLPKLYLCEYCLRYMKSRVTLNRHTIKCVWRHPPGEEVYRKEKVSVWEVDGKRYKSYCQNLCLLAKFFLDHKTLYYDVEPFLFYVMTIADSDGCHTVGYFSKEKNSFLNYNVSCILTLPPYQRQGYGRLLIDFSYLLTRVEGKIGSPEKPLSDLGLISYRSYWKDVLLEYLCNLGGKTLSVKDISQEMAINSYDIVSTLQALGMMKYWKGKHIILKKQDVIEEYVERTKRRGPSYKEIDPECLKWTPYVAPHNPQNT